MDIESFEPIMVFQNDDGLNFGGISADKKFMAFTKTITRDNNEMYLYTVENKEMKHISEHEGDINFSPSDFSLDGKTLYFRTNKDNEFMYLKKYDIESGNTEDVLKFDWDIMYAYLSFNEKYRPLSIGVSKTLL